MLLSLKDNTEQALLRDNVNAVVITGKLKVKIDLCIICLGDDV